MPEPYYFLPQLLLRAPHYSFAGYDLARVPEALGQPDFRQAIWLASPLFHGVLAGKDFDFGRLSAREIHTLYKYYNRICFRPTPFGTFASFTLLKWGDGEAVKLGGGRGLIHLLPDQQTLNQVHAHHDGPLPAQQFMVNPTLYRVAGLYRYAKSARTESSRLEFSLEALDAVRFHQGLIARFKGKALVGSDLLEWIAVRGDCSPEEALDYLQFLVGEQVLLSTAHSRMIYADAPWDEAISLPGWNTFWQKHHRIPASPALSLSGLATELATLTGAAALSSQPFYAALEKPHLGGGPGPGDQHQLSDAVNLLQLLALPYTSPDLTTFVREFSERFDQEKVPLLTALDADTGIAYGDLQTPAVPPKALENVWFPESAPRETGASGWTAVHRLLLRLWTGDALRDPFSPIELTATHRDELAAAAVQSSSVPQTLALMYRRTGEHLVIESAGGATATALTGRFSCFSDSVHELSRELAGKEVMANPGVAFADISQRSDDHVDNINRRRPIYPYEIPVNVAGALPPSMQLPPGDLLLSVFGGELVLESKKLGKRVIPRLATAYNFRHNRLPVFRLLCDLQFQGICANLAFDPETLFPGLRYYPRVASGKVILSLAKWKFRAEDLAELNRAPVTEAAARLEQFRRAHRLPRHITLGASDQQLVFDLAHPPEALFFLQCLQGQPAVTIREYLLPGRQVLSGHKPLAGQMIALLAHDRAIYRPLPDAGPKPLQVQERDFPLGSDWLYLKFFCTPRIADELLASIILPEIRQQWKHIRQWFFIRYTEQGYHLRLRLQVEPDRQGQLLAAFRTRLRSAGYDRLIRSYQGDTYRRELERYGIAAMPLIEAVFCAGSELVAAAVGKRRADTGGWEELELALLSAGQMIRCWLPEDQSYLSFVRHMSDAFIREFGGDKNLRVSMDAKYRELRELIDRLPRRSPMGKLISALRQLAPAVSNVTEERRRTLLADLVHMQMNRTFTVRQRQQELLVYYLLQKQAKSAIARGR